MKYLIICRGKSGSGKTTFAKLIESICNISQIGCKIICADDYFMSKDGKYKFDVSKLGYAHKTCLNRTYDALCVQQIPIVVVHNTFTTEKEINPYIQLAKKYGYKLFSIVLENRHGNKNTHNVPEDTLKNQEDRLFRSIKL